MTPLLLMRALALNCLSWPMEIGRILPRQCRPDRIGAGLVAAVAGRTGGGFGRAGVGGAFRHGERCSANSQDQPNPSASSTSCATNSQGIEELYTSIPLRQFQRERLPFSPVFYSVPQPSASSRRIQARKWQFAVARMPVNPAPSTPSPGRRALARTSKTPGRTRLVNFFELTPGARPRSICRATGYAAAGPRVEIAGWAELIEGLGPRQSLRGLMLIRRLAARHPARR